MTKRHSPSSPSGEPGDGRDLHELVQLLYAQLKGLAGAQLAAEHRHASLAPSDLAHEALRRMLGQRATPANRSHFLALAATEMRRVLVDRARARLAEKRGGGAERVPLSEHLPLQLDEPYQVLAFDDALARLAERSPRLARVVELRYLGGMTVAETASALGVGIERVRDDWRFARAWLNRELLGG
ncbi:MAG TPA: ECF-type sigma factor [Planctomycetota bacterium]